MNISFIARPVHTYDREYSSRESYSTTFGQRKCKLRQKSPKYERKKKKEIQQKRTNNSFFLLFRWHIRWYGFVSFRFLYFISYDFHAFTI